MPNVAAEAENSKSPDPLSILVTGGTGSFGRQFAKTVLREFEVSRLVIYSRDEQKQYEMASDPAFAEHPAVRFFIGDVRDFDRLRLAMRDIGVVVHAAAMKHVPIAEYNPFECIKTNVIGAENVVRAALENRVAKVIALSTDKACNPINLYGASKLASDKIFVASNNMSGNYGTRFSVVRYGNVVGSKGSVVPLFRKLIRNNAAQLPVTDKRMTRFWITLDQGVRFVLDALKNMYGGEILVPKLPSLRIMDLAHAMAPELPVDIVGIRPGEKLHESLISVDDARVTLDLGDHYVIEPAFSWWNKQNYAHASARKVEESFVYSSDANDQWLTVEQMREMIAEFT
jgi:UDP-N-acetylglucosamine 4,6-dehydratase/5-epimerase